MTIRSIGILIGALLIFVSKVPHVHALGLGDKCVFNLTDVDGRKLAATDGPDTALVIVPRKDLDKARLVGEKTPDRCLGNPKFRMITVIEFSRPPNGSARFLLTAVVRQRVAAEAKRLKSRYLANKVNTDPRQDVHVVADFDGLAASQLGLSESPELKVLILGSDGKLLREWNNVPTSQELDAALR